MDKGKTEKMNMVAESLRNALIAVLTFIFAIILIVAIIFVLYKFVFSRIDWVQFIANSIKGAIK